MSERLQVSAGEGRLLDVELAGPEDGQVVLFQPGTPSSAFLFEPMVQAGSERGLRHVSYSRPGYGNSARQPGRSVSDCAADIRAVTDELGVERFYTAGWSGGGPHALAAAALLPDRVLAAATLAGVAPFEAEGLDFLAGMGQDNHEEFGAALAGEETLREYLEPAARGLAEATAEDIAAEMGDLLSEVDQAALTGDFAEYMSATSALSVLNGPWGWLDDDLAFTRPWGFELSKIDVPVTVWQGGEDRFVPFAHGEWLAANVAGARARLLPQEGHLSIVLASYEAVLDDLLELRATTS